MNNYTSDNESNILIAIKQCDYNNLVEKIYAIQNELTEIKNIIKQKDKEIKEQDHKIVDDHKIKDVKIEDEKIKDRKIEDAKIENSANYYGCMTLNFKDGSKIEDIKKVMKLIENKKWLFNNLIYVYEQTGDSIETMGKHPYIHLLFKRNGKRPQQVINEFKNSIFGKGHTNETLMTKQNFDCSNPAYNMWKPRFCSINNEKVDFYDEKVKYMLGIKYDESKLENVKTNTYWRKQHNLKNIYGNIQDYKKYECVNYRPN